MPNPPDKSDSPVPQRLLDAARTCFLNDDYHNVSIRRLAAEAATNSAMIRYYFGSKEGLFEEMIRETLAPLLERLADPRLNTPQGLGDFLWEYYRTMSSQPAFPRLILKILALNQGPGRRFVQQLVERGRTQGARRVEDFQQQGVVDADVDADFARIAFLSLAMTPMLLKEAFEEQMERPVDDTFLQGLAQFNGTLLSLGLAASQREDE